MSRAEELAAKAARMKAANQSAPSVEPQVDESPSTSVSTDLSTSVPQSAPPEVRQTVRSRPVRLTVDVAPTEHTELIQLTMQAAATLGAARVPGQELVRALIRRYLGDPQLQQLVLRDVAEHRRTNRLR